MSTAEADRTRRVLDRLAWLSDDREALVPALIAHGRLAAFGAGEWIHTEGDEATGLLIVIEGVVQFYCAAPGDREVLIGHAESGAAIGQALRFGGGPRIVTAIAVEPSRVLVVTDTALERIGHAAPSVWRAVARLLYAQVRILTRNMAETISLPPRQRLASRLLMLTNRAGRTEPVLRMSQTALAELLGVTRKTVNTYLRQFVRSGLVELGYGRIVVRDGAGLNRIANS